MKAKKLPSGNWRCQVLDYVDDNGKHHNKSFTAPTKKQAELLATQYALTKRERSSSGTVGYCVQEYIRVKESVLSPQTIVGYQKIYRTDIQGEKIERVKLSALNSVKVQEWIGQLSKRLSPKSVKNAYGLLTAILTLYSPNTMLRVKLPQTEEPELHLPTAAEVASVIRYAKQNDRELYRAIILAATGGFRRSEICALTAGDIDREHCKIRVNKAAVHDKTNKVITKAPKTKSSYREVDVPRWVIDEMPCKGRLVLLTPNQITNRFCRVIKKLEVEPFRFHDLRHFFASSAVASGMDIATAKKEGGWSKSNTMERHYLEAVEDGKDIKVMKLHDRFSAFKTC